MINNIIIIILLIILFILSIILIFENTINDKKIEKFDNIMNKRCDSFKFYNKTYCYPGVKGNLLAENDLKTSCQNDEKCNGYILYNTVENNKKGYLCRDNWSGTLNNYDKTDTYECKKKCECPEGLIQKKCDPKSGIAVCIDSDTKNKLDTLITYTDYDITSEPLKNKIQNKIDSLDSKFNPLINSLDSKFNPLINYTGYDITSEPLDNKIQNKIDSLDSKFNPLINYTGYDITSEPLDNKIQNKIDSLDSKFNPLINYTGYNITSEPLNNKIQNKIDSLDSKFNPLINYTGYNITSEPLNNKIQNKIDSFGQLHLLENQFYKSYNFSKQENSIELFTLTELPDNSKAILVEIFFGKDSKPGGDHQVHRFGKNHKKIYTWQHGENTDPTSRFTDGLSGVNLGEESTVEINIHGETDDFSHYYGRWFSSIIIPLDTNNKIYYSNFGNSDSTGWIYMKVRGYYT